MPVGLSRNGILQILSCKFFHWYFYQILRDCWNIFSFPIQWPSSLSIIFLLLKSCIDSFLGCILAQTLAAWLVAVTWLVAGFANFLANSDSVCKLVNNNPIKIETVRPFTTAFEPHSKQINTFCVNCLLLCL